MLVTMVRRGGKLRGLGFALVGLLALAITTPAGAAGTSLHPCNLLRPGEATTILGGLVDGPNSIAGIDACGYSLVPGQVKGYAPTLNLWLTAKQKAVQNFQRAINPKDHFEVRGRVPSGETSEELQPHRVRLDGVASYYVGPLPAHATQANTPYRSITFTTFTDGTVIRLELDNASGTLIQEGQAALVSILQRLSPKGTGAR